MSSNIHLQTAFVMTSMAMVYQKASRKVMEDKTLKTMPDEMKGSLLVTTNAYLELSNEFMKESERLVKLTEEK